MATQIESVSPQTAPRGAGTQPDRHEAAGRGVLERFSYDDAIVRWFMSMLPLKHAPSMMTT